jgi:hypothetical protein
MTARAELVALLSPLLPDFVVVPYSKDITPPTKTSVLVRLDLVEAMPELPLGFRRYTFDVIVVAANAEAGAGDDEIDAALEDVLLVLDTSGRTTWTRAERGVFQSTQTPCYDVTVVQRSEVVDDDTPPE